MSQTPGQMISHYRLLEKIGEGGMGVVWRAEDTVLGRTVAIKLLPAEVSRDENRRRLFLEEARLASSVGDARIVQVFELGQENEQDFIVMEHVEGRSLDRILRGSPLPPDRVVGIGVQIATALSRAHRRGLVHRDLKPANVLVTGDGDVKVVDFGLAALFQPAVEPGGPEDKTRPPAADALSGRRTGGTLPYMSPEQIRGAGADPRSDVFSLGVMLYEMTTGQRPFRAATSADLMAAILRGRPAPVHDLVPDVPLELDRIVQKAIAARPADRYQTMDDLAVDLKRLERELDSGSAPSYEDLKPASRRRLAAPILGGIAVLVAAVAVAAWWLATHRTPPASAHTVLILPLEVRGQKEGADYVGRVFAEAIAVNLAPAKNLKVLPVSDPKELPAGEPQQRAREALRLGAGRLITGALIREGSSVTASVHLLDAQENRILWGTQQTSATGDLPALSSGLARELGAQLGATFGKLYDYPWNLSESPAIEASPITAEVLGALARGKFPEAAQAAERLVAAFPGQTPAIGLRALARYRLWWTRETTEHRAAFDAALAQLDAAESGTPHAEIMRAQVEKRGRPVDAISRLDRVVARSDLAPKVRSWAYKNRGTVRSESGDEAGALADFEQALRASPGDAWVLTDYSLALRRAGRSAEAVTRALQAVALAPENPRSQQTLGLALSTVGRHQEASEAAHKACTLDAQQDSCANYAMELLHLGREPEATAAGAHAESLPDTPHGVYDLACYCALRSDPKRALQFLKRSVELGLIDEWIAKDPDLESLHGDPEFEKIVADVKNRAKKP